MDPINDSDKRTTSAIYEEPPLSDREKTIYTVFACIIGFTLLLMLFLVFGLTHSPAIN